MREPLWAVGLDADNTVIAIRELRPRRIVWIRGARSILELSATEKPPTIGTSTIDC
jgi:hypothetical protein